MDHCTLKLLEILRFKQSSNINKSLKYIYNNQLENWKINLNASFFFINPKKYDSFLYNSIVLKEVNTFKEPCKTRCMKPYKASRNQRK